MRAPALIVQGTRDTLGSRTEVEECALAKSIRFHWLEDGDHGFKPRQRSGYAQEQHWADGVKAVAEFIHEST